MARSTAGSTLRNSTFIDGSLILQIGRYVRRVGRPRNEWASKVGEAALRVAGSSRQLEVLVSNIPAWNSAVCRYVGFSADAL